MTQTIELIPVGNGVGIVLTPEMLEKLGARPGGSVSVSMTDGGLELRKADDDLAEQMAVARRVMREDRDVLRRLAE